VDEDEYKSRLDSIIDAPREQYKQRRAMLPTENLMGARRVSTLKR
jgi:hypothetical protein